MKFIALLISCTGFIVPFLLIPALLKHPDVWNNKKLIWRFGIIAIGLFAMYAAIPFFHGSSRYIFTPLIFIMLFIGCGVAAFTEYLPFRISVYWVMGVLIICTTAMQIVRTVTRERKSYLIDFADSIAAKISPEKKIIIYGRNSDHKKLVNILNKRGYKARVATDAESIDVFIFDEMLENDWQSTEFLFAVGISHDETVEHWVENFRSIYNIAPLDVIAKTSYRKREQILFHFNKKVSDNILTSQTLVRWPDILPFECGQVNEIAVLDENLFKHDLILRADAQPSFYCATRKNYWYFNGTKNAVPERVTFYLLNTLFWPMQKATYIRNEKNNCFVRENVNQIEQCSVATESGFLKLPEYAETPSTTTNKLSSQPLDILLITTSRSSGFKWQETLSKVCADNKNIKATVYELPGVISPLQAQQQLLEQGLNNLPTGNYSHIIVDLLPGNIIGGDLFCWNEEALYTQWDRVIATLMQKYFKAEIFWFLPPIPADNCRYPGGKNGRMQQLAHVRFSYLAKEFFKQHTNVGIIDLSNKLFSDKYFYLRNDKSLLTPYGMKAEVNKFVLYQIVEYLLVN